MEAPCQIAGKPGKLDQLARRKVPQLVQQIAPVFFRT